MFVALVNRFLHWMVVGLISPVLALLILSKGVSLSAVGLIVGLSSACVVVFEIPSGVLSDRWGRKTVYLLSLALSLGALITMFFGIGTFGMALGFALFGVARAFSSGSIESDFIDRHVETRGEASLHTLIAGMNAAEALGLAGGAVLGGLIPMGWARVFPKGNAYGGNLAVMAALVALLFVLTLLGHRGSPGETRNSLASFASEALETIRSTPGLAPIILGASAWGVSFFAVETYWQPRVRDILGGTGQSWVFGLLSAGYFAFAVAGSVLAGVFGGRFGMAPFLWLAGFRLLLGAAIAALAVASGIAGFTVPFFLIMALNGMAGVPESTVANRIISAKNRATMLSVASFATQVGGIAGSLGFSYLLQTRGIPLAWTVAGAVFAASGALYFVVGRRLGPLAPASKGFAGESSDS